MFVVGRVVQWLERHGDRPFFLHASFIRPHPPRRNPPGYHDLYSADDVGPFVAAPTREIEAALHPLNRLVMGLPGVGAPDEERERRQLRATYYGAQREVDDVLATLFDYLEHSGLAGSTLVVLTSDHGEMGCDHRLVEKLGYWDESYHVPLVVRDPGVDAEAGWGRVVDACTESVDVLPTLCDWLGIEVPLQADGWSLSPFLRGDPVPERWREEAHFEWHFSNPRTGVAEKLLGLPMSHCSLAVARGPRTKYVQFAADPSVLPPLLFDLEEDPGQLEDRLARPDGAELGWEARPAPRAVADAQRGTHLERPAAHPLGAGRGPRRLALGVGRPRAAAPG